MWSATSFILCSLSCSFHYICPIGYGTIHYLYPLERISSSTTTKICKCICFLARCVVVDNFSLFVLLWFSVSQSEHQNISHDICSSGVFFSRHCPASLATRWIFQKIRCTIHSIEILGSARLVVFGRARLVQTCVSFICRVSGSTPNS